MRRRTIITYGNPVSTHSTYSAHSASSVRRRLSAALPFTNPNAFTVGAANPLSEKGYFLLFNHQFEIE